MAPPDRLGDEPALEGGAIEDLVNGNDVGVLEERLDGAAVAGPDPAEPPEAVTDEVLGTRPGLSPGFLSPFCFCW